MTTKVIGEKSLPSMPWEDRPQNCNDTVWRYSKNPIIMRNQIPCSNSIFNSAVVPFENSYAGVFRADHKSRVQWLHTGFSKDGINWDISNEPIKFKTDISEIAHFEYGYDPRVCFIEDRYYVTWCNGYKKMPTIGIAYTYDFKEYVQLENAYLPFNRNGVMFPRKINGEYVMLSRPSDNAHTAFGDIYLSHSKDLVYWGKHRHVMSPGINWESTKIGAGPIPIETDKGWLMFYHGVLWSCNGFVYSFGAALLDLNEPNKVLKRSRDYLISPQELYECVGDVPNVCFPCANLVDADTGRIAIYYGVADTHTALSFTTVDMVLDFLDKNPL